jgi:hypothetical protein
MRQLGSFQLKASTGPNSKKKKGKKVVKSVFPRDHLLFKPSSICWGVTYFLSKFVQSLFFIKKNIHNQQNLV